MCLADYNRIDCPYCGFSRKQELTRYYCGSQDCIDAERMYGEPSLDRKVYQEYQTCSDRSCREEEEHEQRRSGEPMVYFRMFRDRRLREEAVYRQQEQARQDRRRWDEEDQQRAQRLQREQNERDDEDIRRFNEGTLFDPRPPYEFEPFQEFLDDSYKMPRGGYWDPYYPYR